jgi:hypothetical protein
MDKDLAKEIAAAEGLPKLAQGVASARELAQKLPKDLHWSEEIALIFRLPPSGEPKR